MLANAHVKGIVPIFRLTWKKHRFIAWIIGASRALAWRFPSTRKIIPTTALVIITALWALGGAKDASNTRATNRKRWCVKVLFSTACALRCRWHLGGKLNSVSATTRAERIRHECGSAWWWRGWLQQAFWRLYVLLGAVWETLRVKLRR